MKQASKNRQTMRRGSSKLRGSCTTRAILGRDEAGAEVQRINPKWAWHYRVLLGLRDRLLKDRSEQLAQAGERLESYSMDMADSATDAFDHDLALSELSAEQDALYEVDEALKRILNGTYGVCEETGKPIPAARLRAIPWTRFTKEVETRLEQEDGVGHVRLGRLRSVREAKRATLAPTSEELEALEVKMEKAEEVGKESIQQPEEAESTENERSNHHEKGFLRGLGHVRR